MYIYMYRHTNAHTHTCTLDDKKNTYCIHKAEDDVLKWTGRAKKKLVNQDWLKWPGKAIMEESLLAYLHKIRSI